MASWPSARLTHLGAGRECPGSSTALTSKPTGRRTSKPWRSTRLGRRRLREYIRDPSGRTLGYIEDIGVGTRIEARDVSGRLLAYYDKHLNQTRHPDGRLF